MTDLTADYRQDHLANYMVPVGPPLIFVVTTFFVIAQVVDVLTTPSTFLSTRILTVLASVALFGFAPVLSHFARAGRTNAAALSAITFLTLMSIGITHARYADGMHWMMMLPYAGIYTMISTLLWSRKTHLGLGLLGSMGIPSVATLVTATTASEFFNRLVFVSAMYVFSIALYFLLHRIHTLNYRIALDARYRAHHDWLTGLINRQRWMELARGQFDHATGLAAPMSLLYIDIDHFKQTNDQFGHEAGDRQLQMVAQTLRSEMPNDAIIGRFGGEEFVVLLPRTMLAGAVAFSEQFNHGLAHNPTSLAPLTASIGIAEWVNGETIETLIMRADRAMLQAKALGRSQTVVAGPIILRPQPQPRSMPTPTYPEPLWIPVGETADHASSI
ncbi:MAG TPA: GGDEF domain-containing protein [Thermomicrobiales bacterium]|nr:GGDEF domain-containing protein [Thermomicrobiales bacterium]